MSVHICLWERQESFEVSSQSRNRPPVLLSSTVQGHEQEAHFAVSWSNTTAMGPRCLPDKNVSTMNKALMNLYS